MLLNLEAPVGLRSRYSLPRIYLARLCSESPLCHDFIAHDRFDHDQI
jgi:hypothetical protein